jgi:glucokinase
MKKYAIGSDIGGSHISCAVIDLEKKSLLRQSLRTQKVNNHAPADKILSDWCMALNHTMGLVSKNDLAGIGFAMPGPFNYPEGIALFTGTNAKYEKLFNIPVADELSKRLDLSPDRIRFINDATAFAVGEAWIGKVLVLAPHLLKEACLWSSAKMFRKKAVSGICLLKTALRMIIFLPAGL